MDNKRTYRKVPFTAEALVLTEFPKGTQEPFNTRLTAHALIGYGTPVGTTNTANVMNTGTSEFEYANIGTQTILAPVFSSDGYNIGFDQTNGEGVELTRGITSRSPSAVVVGTDKAYFEFQVSIEDVSGVGELAVGFRKTQAYQLALDDYTDMAVLNVQGGTINLETILNNGATTTTNTGETVADNETVTLRVEVYTDGTCSYFVDGVRVLASNTFTFDSGDVLVPFVHFVNSADLAGAVNAKYWKDGPLDDK